MIDKNHASITVSRQCEWLGLSRSSLYYQSGRDDSFNVHLMNLIDAEYTRHPFFGYPRMTQWLKRQGHSVNKKRIARLMGIMGIEAIYPKRRTTTPHPSHKKYPYLLRGLTIGHPDHVWAADITYVRMNRGFAYLVAVMDWFSRFVVSWELSNTLAPDFCIDALESALTVNRPEIFNSDQGSQFTSNDFTGVLNQHSVQISMDGRGRVFDNIFIERLWRTVKYEEIYLYDYSTIREARQRLHIYFDFYNSERCHQSLGYQTPKEIYHGV